jgi:hypothetical protein
VAEYKEKKKITEEILANAHFTDSDDDGLSSDDLEGFVEGLSKNGRAPPAVN